MAGDPCDKLYQNAEDLTTPEASHVYSVLG
jgi:hypothetical protein